MNNKFLLNHQAVHATIKVTTCIGLVIKKKIKQKTHIYKKNQHTYTHKTNIHYII